MPEEEIKVQTYLQLYKQICRRNLRLLDISLKTHHLFHAMQRSVWKCIDAPLHVLHNNTTTMI